MPLIAPRSRMFELRYRLARKLALLAGFGLLATATLLLSALGAVLAALLNSWEGINAGEPLTSGGWSLAAVVIALCAAQIADVLFSSAPPPSGIRLPRAAAEDFYRLIDAIADRLGAKPVRNVWITGDMNALVLQRAGWGGCGPLRTHLMFGLPLTHSLSPNQFAAVLAHEFAHLAIQRRGWGATGAHLRAWWMRTLDRAGRNLPVLELLLDKASRRFCRDMLRLARVEEFEADALAAQLVGSSVLGDTLVELGLKTHFLQHDYWPRVMAQSVTREQPTIRPYREMGLGVEAGFVHSASIDDVFGYDDSDGELAFHPTLRQRLRALRVSPRRLAQRQPSAARRYFAPLLPSLAWVFDRAWWEGARSSWRCDRNGSGGERS